MGGRLCAFATTSRVRANCERQELDRRLHDRPAKMASFLGIIEAITKLSIANEADRRPSGCYGACDRGFSWLGQASPNFVFEPMGFPVWRPTQDVRHQDLSFVSDVPFFEGDHVTFAMFQSCIDVAAPFRSDAGTEDSHIFDRDRVKILTITAACAVIRHCLMRQGTFPIKTEQFTLEGFSL